MPLWSTFDDDELAREIEALASSRQRPFPGARIFWKLGPELVYGGCNLAFARDAGFPDPKELVGLDDFDRRVRWASQAGKYRHDDRAVMEARQPQLGIIERQADADAAVWLHTAKAPILARDQVVGIFGMYELIDGAQALVGTRARLVTERSLREPPPAR